MKEREWEKREKRQESCLNKNGQKRETKRNAQSRVRIKSEEPKRVPQLNENIKERTRDAKRER